VPVSRADFGKNCSNSSAAKCGRRKATGAERNSVGSGLLRKYFSSTVGCSPVNPAAASRKAQVEPSGRELARQRSGIPECKATESFRAEEATCSALRRPHDRRRVRPASQKAASQSFRMPAIKLKRLPPFPDRARAHPCRLEYRNRGFSKSSNRRVGRPQAVLWEPRTRCTSANGRCPLPADGLWVLPRSRTSRINRRW